ncbi:hypothetical protein [Halobaculum sp. EA56]|uniref:hypothetical protein n=1 Tax=Halobaculum sp. EA56 TaxID=3421648 RepID=UPI003EBBCBB4
MTEIQQVCFALDGDYMGHPYHVSGSALVHAITSDSARLAGTTLNASTGVFVPGAYGVYPEEHSSGGINPSLGGTLPEVRTYEDLFLFRDASHAWMLDSRPSAATNTHDLRVHGGKPVFAPTTTFGTPPGAFHDRRSVRWYVHAYFHSDNRSVLPLTEDELSELAVGGARNNGYGRLEYVDSQLVDITDLDYSWLEDASQYCIELVSPYVLSSTYPHVRASDIPWWWGVSGDRVRTRETRLVEHGTEYTLNTADHGQVFEYTGSDPIGTAKNGITRAGPHSKYGFGELRVLPQ